MTANMKLGIRLSLMKDILKRNTLRPKTAEWLEEQLDNLISILYMDIESCQCQGENAKTGHVEDWDGICPDCGRDLHKDKRLRIENSDRKDGM